MATIFKPKRTATAGKVPTASDLVDGEFAVNSSDRKLYLRVGASIVDLFANLTTLSGLAAGAGSALVGFIQSGAGAVARTAQAKLRERVSLSDFGAVGDGVADDTAAFNAAIAALPARGGVVYADPSANYKITSKISYTKPILWLCERGVSEISTNTNGGNTETPMVSWGGAGTVDCMFEQKPPAVGQLIWGGGLDGLTLDGANLAQVGIHLDNCRYARLRGKARRFTVAGADISSVSGAAGLFTMKCHVIDWDYVYGAQVSCANSHGLRIRGNGSTLPGTQHRVDRVFALIKHGAGVCVEETDNCQFGSLQAVGDPSGGGGGAATGCTILFRNVGSSVAYNNHIKYLSGGMRNENGCFGNVAEHITSEGGGVGQVSGSANWHGSITDYASASNRFRTHEYKLRDRISIAPAMFLGLSTFYWLSKWVALNFPASGSNVCTAIIPIPAHLHNGVIEGVSVILGTSTSGAGNYRFVAELGAFALNTAGQAGPEVTMTETIAAPAINQFKEHWFTMSELAFAKGDSIFLSLTRLGLDGADSATTDVYLLGARVKYRAAGPSGVSELYLPDWNMP